MYAAGQLPAAYILTLGHHREPAGTSGSLVCMSGNQRAILWSVLLASLMVIAGWIGGGTATALGIALGAGLGLFSLWSLTYAIPRLVTPGHPGRKPLLGLIYVAKLAFFGIVLWWAMKSPLIQPFGVFVDAAVVPIVIVGLRLKSALALST